MRLETTALPTPTEWDEIASGDLVRIDETDSAFLGMKVTGSEQDGVIIFAEAKPSGDPLPRLVWWSAFNGQAASVQRDLAAKPLVAGVNDKPFLFPASSTLFASPNGALVLTSDGPCITLQASKTKQEIWSLTDGRRVIPKEPFTVCEAWVLIAILGDKEDVLAVIKPPPPSSGKTSLPPLPNFGTV